MKSKSLHPNDYDELYNAMALLEEAYTWCTNTGIPLYTSHHHRNWEYASAITAYLEQFNTTDTDVIDIGCGKSPLGPTLALSTNANVLEVDPDVRLTGQRGPATHNRHFMVGDLLTLPLDKQYDAVFAISVIEHIADQETAWTNLAALTKPGGLLFVTTDFGESATTPWQADTERVHKLDPQGAAERILWLQDNGFTLDADTTFNGAHVFDYTFYRFVALRIK